MENKNSIQFKLQTLTENFGMFDRTSKGVDGKF